MGNRQALLIGVEHYGEGFAPLPAVRQDVDRLRATLDAVGYDTSVCSPDILTNASHLDKAVRAFCASGGPDDVRLVYFTGHGLLADGIDWIVPEGTSRHDALASPNQRVSTDLSRTVAESTTGLVLFVIDACRDKEDAATTKGAEAWGDPSRLARPAEQRFIRFFGCAGGQVCQVLPDADGEPAASLFTRALADSLAAREAVTLQDLLQRVDARCAELLKSALLLGPQTPHLSYGESSATSSDVLQRAIFDPIGRASLPGIWATFDPAKLHCLVVLSEYEHNTAPEWGLRDMVRDALAGDTGDRIWASFRSACQGRVLVSGPERKLPESFGPTAIAFGSFSVLEALAGGAPLEAAVRALIEADIVVFDVTSFEPGVMLLVGVRSACCRSLSVCSHGAGWDEGKQIEVPFNLQDLNVNSHTPRGTRVGSDPVVERFVLRVETGFRQLARHPQYLDLPGYDALRHLGSGYAAASTIGTNDRVLILCSYKDGFLRNWSTIASGLKQALWQKGAKPAIERILDYATPQLIRQSLYEQIRRVSACVVDWSEFSASVFLELGARLAVSEFGAVQIIDERYLPGGEKGSKLVQVALLQRLFEPLSYRLRPEQPAAFEAMARLLLERSPNLPGADSAAYNQIHRFVLQVMDRVQVRMPSVVSDLTNRADSLHSLTQERDGVPQVLFHGSRNVKRTSEHMALELRIAAWLYLEHRLSAGRDGAPANLLQVHGELGQSAVNGLYDLGDDGSIAFAAYIEERLTHKE